MALIAKDKVEYEPIPVGVHKAICFWIIDIGTQYSEKFNKYSRQVIIGWELPEERGQFEKDGVSQDMPRVISAKFTLSLGKKSNLRKVLEGWRGRPFTASELDGFDLKNVLGQPCMLVVSPTANGKSKVDTASKYKGEPFKPENPTVFFSFDEPDHRLPDGLPEWIVKYVTDSPEWSGGDQDETNAGEEHFPKTAAGMDEVPF